MLRGFFLIFGLIAIVIVATAGFRGSHSSRTPWEIFPDMVRQQKVRAQAPLGFFADDRGPRVPVAGTVPIGYEPPPPVMSPAPGVPPKPAPADENAHPGFGFGARPDYFSTGKMGENWGTCLPVPVNAELIQRGQQRFNITCSVCHGLTGEGNGMAKQYGLTTVASLQDERIRKMADGEIFNTITNGKNTMMSYGGNVAIPDRWAIICYLRALQRSQNATGADIPPEQMAQLDQAAAPPPAAAAPAPSASPKKP